MGGKARGCGWGVGCSYALSAPRGRQGGSSSNPRRASSLASPGLQFRILAMLPPSPFCLLKATKIAGLQATVLLLLTLLIKARIQIKAASALGLALLALQTLVFLAIAGPLGLAAIGGVAFALNRRQAQAA
jgi:hypothetical protein